MGGEGGGKQLYPPPPMEMPQFHNPADPPCTNKERGPMKRSNEEDSWSIVSVENTDQNLYICREFPAKGQLLQ